MGDLHAKAKAMEEERRANHEMRLREMEKHPRCALLPSPELLDLSMDSPGTDETDTLGDFGLVRDWIAKERLLNVTFYKPITETPENLNRSAREKLLGDGEFGSLVQLAYNNGFSAMRNTANPELEELVFWYYTGHGLGKENVEALHYSSTPCLNEVGLNPAHYEDANGFSKVFEGRKVKGGELCLHKVGFCDLYGLLKPWIAAVKSKSINAGGVKKNKHLVIILDSCHSGILAQDLDTFAEQAQLTDKTLLEENSITIQAACGPDERTFGGYFTPCFVFLNENEELLQRCKDEWQGMSQVAKDEYRSVDLPSPMVVRAGKHPSSFKSQDTTIEMNIQNFHLTLFQDAGFFKFCSIKVYQSKNERFFAERALNATSATQFMAARKFTVLDYKLKTYRGKGPADPHAGTPMGMFLLKDTQNSGFAICAHIHFRIRDTKVHQRINLVRHLTPPLGSVLYVEDGTGKIKVSLNEDATELVTACRGYVDQKEPHRWLDVKQWNMTGIQLGVNGKFRAEKERSLWEGAYLNTIKGYNLPVAK